MERKLKRRGYKTTDYNLKLKRKEKYGTLSKI